MRIMYRHRSACAALALVALSTTLGCTQLTYRRSLESGDALIDPGEFGAPSARFENFHLNQLTWLDPTGVVCAGATTGLEAYNSAVSARDEAIEKGRSTYEYEYNVHAPVSGLYCGGYYRWGEGDITVRDAPARDAIQQQEDVSARIGTWELGFHAEGTEQIEMANWATYSFGFQLAVGKYDWTDEETNRGQIKDYDDPILFRMPTWFGVGIYPTFLFGLGIEARGGVDLIAWALTAPTGQWYQKFDYDVRLAYQLKALNPLVFDVSVGMEQENLHWGEYWLKRAGPYAQVNVMYVF